MVSVTFPKADVDALVKQINRAQTELGKSVKQSVQWAGVNVCGSLAASCKVSPKKRKIVRNPNRKSLTDARIAKFGVMKFNRKGEEKFMPIFSTGEYGKAIMFISRKHVLVRVGTKWEKRDAGTEDMQVPGLMQSPRRDIGRSGLAATLWRRAKGYIFRGGTISAKGVPDLMSVQWVGNKRSPTLQIASRLRYVEKAFVGGRQSVETALARAAAGMSGKIDMALGKAVGKMK